MAFDFALYDSADTSLTTPLGSTLSFVVSANAGASGQDKHFLFGSPTASTKCQMASNPGVDQIPISIIDSTPGSGHATTEVYLATTQVGLDSATGGASLNIGHTVTSGSANVVNVWVRYNPPHPRTVEYNTELSIRIGTGTDSLLQAPV